MTICLHLSPNLHRPAAAALRIIIPLLVTKTTDQTTQVFKRVTCASKHRLWRKVKHIKNEKEKGNVETSKPATENMRLLIGLLILGVSFATTIGGLCLLAIRFGYDLFSARTIAAVFGAAFFYGKPRICGSSQDSHASRGPILSSGRIYRCGSCHRFRREYICLVKAVMARRAIYRTAWRDDMVFGLYHHHLGSCGDPFRAALDPKGALNIKG